MGVVPIPEILRKRERRVDKRELSTQNHEDVAWAINNPWRGRQAKARWATGKVREQKTAWAVGDKQTARSTKPSAS